MPRISKSLPLAALLMAGANAQLSTSSVVLDPYDTAVTTVTYSTCPTFTASVTTITNPTTSTYTGDARPGSEDVTTYVTVCPGFCTGGPSCTDGLGPTTHTITATCPCKEAGPGVAGPGMTHTIAVCPTCGPGGSPITATLLTPMPGSTGAAAPGGSAPGSGAPGPYVAPGSSAPAAGATGSPSSSPGMGPDSPGSGSGAGAAPGGSAAGAGTPGSSMMPGMGSGSPGMAPGMAPGAGSASPSGAGSGSKYSNSSDISPSISSAAGSGTAAQPSAFPGAASRLPVVGGLLSGVAGFCGLLAFLL